MNIPSSPLLQNRFKGIYMGTLFKDQQEEPVTTFSQEDLAQLMKDQTFQKFITLLSQSKGFKPKENLIHMLGNQMVIMTNDSTGDHFTPVHTNTQ